MSLARSSMTAIYRFERSRRTHTTRRGIPAAGQGGRLHSSKTASSTSASATYTASYGSRRTGLPTSRHRVHRSSSRRIRRHAAAPPNLPRAILVLEYRRRSISEPASGIGRGVTTSPSAPGAAFSPLIRPAPPRHCPRIAAVLPAGEAHAGLQFALDRLDAVDDSPSTRGARRISSGQTSLRGRRTLNIG